MPSACKHHIPYERSFLFIDAGADVSVDLKAFRFNTLLPSDVPLFCTGILVARVECFSLSDRAKMSSSIPLRLLKVAVSPEGPGPDKRIGLRCDRIEANFEIDTVVRNKVL